MRPSVQKFMTIAAAGMVAIALVLCGYFAATSLTPATVSASTASEWNLKGRTVIDLSHIQDQTIPADPALKKPTLEFFAHVGQGEGAYWNLETVSYCPHTGTHMDSPFHVNSDWGAMETVDSTVLIGPAIVLNVEASASHSITVADIKAAESKSGPIQAGDGVLVHTGHDANWPNKAAYIDNGYPIFTKEAAEYIASKRPRYIGMETISPDGPNTIAHKVFMGGGVIIVENLTNIDKIGQPRCTTIGTFPNIKGATGVYMRLLAVR